MSHFDSNQSDRQGDSSERTFAKQSPSEAQGVTEQGSDSANTRGADWRVRRLRQRITFSLMLLFCPLFLHSCSLSELKLSIGPAAPIVILDIDEDSLIPQGVGGFSALGLVANVAFVITLVSLLPLAPVQAFLVSRSYRISLWTFVIVANCILLGWAIPAVVYVWHYGMVIPITWIGELVKPCVEAAFVSAGERTSDHQQDIRITTMAVSSRLYFVIVLAVGPLCVLGARWFRRRVLQVSPDRWWQFTLRGWILLTLIISALLGLAVRLALWGAD